MVGLAPSQVALQAVRCLVRKGGSSFYAAGEQSGGVRSLGPVRDPNGGCVRPDRLGLQLRVRRSLSPFLASRTLEARGRERDAGQEAQVGSTGDMVCKCLQFVFDVVDTPVKSD